MKSRSALVLIVALLGFACAEAAGKSGAPSAEATAETPQEPQVRPAAAQQEVPVAVSAAADIAGTSTYMDLVALLHLADVYDSAGLLIDFGTPARAKYTNGNWNSGWLGEHQEGGHSVSSFGKTARVYLPMDATHPMQLRIRAKAYATGPLITYLNGKTLKEVRASVDEGFVELVVPIPRDGIQPGENAVLFRATKTRQVRGKARSFAVDWVRVEPATPEAQEGAAPVWVVANDASAAGEARRSIRLAAGSRIEWFVEVPKGAALVFGAAATSDAAGLMEVAIDSDRKTSGQDLKLRESWSDHSVSLDSLSSDIARVRFRNAGTTDLLVSDVRIVRKAGEPVAIEKPVRNVIVLLIDTLRASKLSVYNPKTRVKTPALDSFAAEGTVFERPQAPENWTKPSVASVLTSLHPATHNTKEDASKLPKSALMLSEVYQKAGFETGSFIANGYVSNAFGFDQGWDYYTNYIRERRNTNASNVFGEATSWIEKNKGKRFFAYIQTIDPHVPYDPPDAFLKMYDPAPYKGQVQNRRTHLMLDEAKKNPKKFSFTKRDKERIEALHDGEISYHDEQFGKFLAKLRELGLEDDTLIVITSDHGEEFQEHGSWGHGHSVYQELLGVPLLFRWPGVIPAGARVAPVVSTMDLGPTVLEASGVPIPKEFEGHSLLGFMRGDWPMGPYVAFSDFLDHRRVIRGGDWKLIIRGNLSQVIFDLESDPGEQKELDGRANPIAQRYLRTLHGQFLGAKDRGKWLAAATDATGEKRLNQEKQAMTPELCRQLVALGYISAECDEILSN